MQPRFFLVILWLVFGAPALAEEPIGDAINDVPIFDAHIHYKEPAWAPFPVDRVIRLMNRNGVSMGLVSSTPDEGTIKLKEYAPNRIVTSLRPYHDGWGSSDWMDFPGMADYIDDRLARFNHAALGEFHVRSLQERNEPIMRHTARRAVELNIPLHIHSDAPPIDAFFEFEPTATIIWAHAGMTEPPQVVERMLAKYENLYVDTSYREFDILKGDGSIDPRWRKVIEKFPERIMVGSDTWVNGQWDQYDALIDINRQWLSQFPREIAEMIAYKNAEKLFGVSVTKDQIGTR